MSTDRFNKSMGMDNRIKKFRGHSWVAWTQPRQYFFMIPAAHFRMNGLRKKWKNQRKFNMAMMSEITSAKDYAQKAFRTGVSLKFDITSCIPFDRDDQVTAMFGGEDQ